jgi:hypothetical protein
VAAGPHLVELGLPLTADELLQDEAGFSESANSKLKMLMINPAIWSR